MCVCMCVVCMYVCMYVWVFVTLSVRGALIVKRCAWASSYYHLTSSCSRRKRSRGERTPSLFGGDGSSEGLTQDWNRLEGWEGGRQRKRDGREEAEDYREKGRVCVNRDTWRKARERELNQGEMKGVSYKGVKHFSHVHTWSVCLLLRTRCVGGVEVTTAAFLTACNPCTKSSRVTWPCLCLSRCSRRDSNSCKVQMYLSMTLNIRLIRFRYRIDSYRTNFCIGC